MIAHIVAGVVSAVLLLPLVAYLWGRYSQIGKMAGASWYLRNRQNEQ